MSATNARWGRPIETIVASLHYLELGSPDPASAAAFYQRALGYQLEERGDKIIVAAPGRRLILTTGSPKSLLVTGYAVPDMAELDRLRARILTAGASFQEVTSPFFTTAIETADPDGNRFIFGVANGHTGQQPYDDGPVARLQHVVVSSTDPEPIVRFFTDALGFTLSDDVVDDEGAVRTSFLRSSNEHHSFAVFKAPQNRFDHHCYETTDWNMIRDWCDHVGAQRIPVQWGPGRHGPGNNLFMFVHDPDGNWVEISAELELVDHDRPVRKWPHEQHTLNSWGKGLLRS